MDLSKTTPFRVIYDRFLSKITDDLYLELTEQDTYNDLQTILINSISGFEFPRFPIFNYQIVEYLNADGDEAIGYFESVLTLEEIDIISDLMMIEWLRRQIASVENTRMKYSGSDFKFTSQANHLDKLLKTKLNFEQTNKHKQRLYKRRKINSSTGMIESNWSGLAGGAISGN
ncbi:MAG: hypothetical protein J6A25_04755 [Lachnospiraceae bacterium]|nr:hypothetical protein [Lachnospiraceae bacterium]MBP3905968.1 hypothetical protein [Peptostreptococcaceae bacterium]